MDTLKRRFIEKYEETQLKTIRDFKNTIDWKDRLIGIRGQRGVGKTTMLLQYIKKNFQLDKSVIYVSLDHIYFSTVSLYNFTEEFVSKGGKYLFLDEVHRYKNWGQEIKNIYDDFSGLKIVFTGSSILHIKKVNADLSRRAVMYEMPGLSFREFINFETNQQLMPHSLNEIINNHTLLATTIRKKNKPLSLFNNYLDFGFYTFYLENKNTFHQRLSETLNIILEVDIPQFEVMQISHISKLKQLLYIISESVPFKPNLLKLAERTGISVNTLKTYLQYLEDARIIHQLKQDSKGISQLSKPEKIYLHNTNLLYNLASDAPNKGNLRETFFANQVGVYNKLNASIDADFIVDRKYTFEVGGKNKSQKQIRELKNAFIVKDDIEIGFDNQIPLWLLGFLY